ncbi:MAG: hypothetical protein R2724_11530 [Bryobacterales bacterium]
MRRLLRAALSGHLPHEEFTSKRMYEALDLCLECKGCKRECPSNVDLAKIKYEFLAHYYEKNGTPLRAKFFSNAKSLLNKVGSAFAPVSNWMLGLAPVRKLNEAILGVDARREGRRLPPRRSRSGSASALSSRAPTRRAKWRSLPTASSSGTIRMGRADLSNCSKRPASRSSSRRRPPAAAVRLSQGIPRRRARKGREQCARARALRRSRRFVLGCEPSCLLTLRDEYVDLVKEAVRKVAANAFLLDEFLVARAKQGKLDLKLDGGPRKVLLHGHCHQKSHVGTAPTIEALKLIPGCEVSEINSGCCGMAGSFGFEKEHYELSEKIGRERLFPAVEAADADTEIAITGVSCRQQIGHFTQRQPRHAIEILRDAIR